MNWINCEIPEIHPNHGDPYNSIKSCKECGDDMSAYSEEYYCEDCLKEVE